MNPDAPLSITLANTYAAEGGAARAANRLLKALRGAGSSARLLCQFAGQAEPGVLGPGSRAAKAWAQAGRILEDQISSRIQKSPTLFSPAFHSWGEVPRTLLNSEGIVHLHWVQKGFLSIEDIGRLQRPLFWTLHDMWPLTCGVHYGDQEALTRPRHGLGRSVWDRKKRAWADLAVTVISPSRWLADLAAQSPFFRDRRIVVIPNTVDTHLYRPVDSQWARSLLGIPADKKVVLFGAMDATSDPRKGFDLLVRALEGWTVRDSVHLIILGSSEAPGLSSLGYRWSALGHLSDDLSMVVAYNAADLVVVPSRQENLSNMLLEALSCGVPCVGFDLGGNPDAIVPGITGELAKPEDAGSLRSALQRVLFDGQTRDEWAEKTRAFAVQEFSHPVAAARHLAAYQASL